ncbi:MAG: hypothetical protein ACK40O_11375 [Allosphingosinicella sp.]
MKLLAGLPLLLLVAACAVPRPEYRRVTSLHYEAAGADPAWHLTIADDTMRLVLHDPPHAPSGTSYATVQARTKGMTTVWTAGGGLGAPTVEARREVCIAADGTRYEDEVTISLSGRQLHGCGGNRLMGRRG